MESQSSRVKKSSLGIVCHMSEFALHGSRLPPPGADGSVDRGVHSRTAVWTEVGSILCGHDCSVLHLTSQCSTWRVSHLSLGAKSRAHILCFLSVGVSRSVLGKLLVHPPLLCGSLSSRNRGSGFYFSSAPSPLTRGQHFYWHLEEGLPGDQERP